jgi:lysophospholipase L1-like esterase
MNLSNLLSKLATTGISLFVSILFIWVVGYFFCNSLDYYKYDPQLNKFIHAPFLTYKHRTEGFASTKKGLFGINAIEDITKDGRRKIIVWGDSYIEGHQVNDKLKIPQVITKKLTNDSANSQIMSFAVGMSGDSVADYYFDIPKYESLVKSVAAHYIVITSINDILPDQLSDTTRGLFKSNPLEIYHDKWHPEFQKAKAQLNNFGLYFIWQPIRSLISTIKKITFIPTAQISHVENKAQQTYSPQFLQESWEFLLSELRKQTSKPLVFIYCPHVPKIEENKISITDPDQQQIELFSKIAKKNNIQFLNSSYQFINFYETTGLFPRGFSNSKPSVGHFNKYGHEIVSRLIVDHLKEIGSI